MFKHKFNDTAKEGEEKENKEEETKDTTEVVAEKPPVGAATADYTSPGALKELMEKNLKWSQIIYEQNRRINRKLFWSAFLGWLKFLIIIGSLIVGGWYLQPYLKGLLNQYGQLMGMINGTQGAEQGAPASSVEDMMKIFNLSPEQQERIKGMLK